MTGTTRQDRRTRRRNETSGALALVERVRRRREAPDGVPELVAAIHAVRGSGGWDPSREPVVTEPSELFALTFFEAGLSGAQMPLLRARLAASLPRIADDLAVNAQVLDQPGHRIESYAALVRIALLLKVK